jgi:hypothetical protein
MRIRSISARSTAISFPDSKTSVDSGNEIGSRSKCTVIVTQDFLLRVGGGAV